MLCYKVVAHMVATTRMETGEMEQDERSPKEAVEIICPKCRYTEIVYLPIADLPLCPKCKTQMMISELLDEGKSY